MAAQEFLSCSKTLTFWRMLTLRKYKVSRSVSFCGEMEWFVLMTSHCVWSRNRYFDIMFTTINPGWKDLRELTCHMYVCLLICKECAWSDWRKLEETDTCRNGRDWECRLQGSQGQSIHFWESAGSEDDEHRISHQMANMCWKMKQQKKMFFFCRWLQVRIGLQSLWKMGMATVPELFFGTSTYQQTARSVNYGGKQ